MRIGSVGLLLLWVVLQFCFVEAAAIDISPYRILQVTEDVSNRELDQQYRRLRSKHRRNRAKKNMIKKAYDKILFDRQFPPSEPAPAPIPTLPNLPAAGHIDQTYVHGYKLGDEFDDGRYFTSHFNETQFILEKMDTVEANKKTARMLLMGGGLFLKLIPCVLLYCFCRRGGAAGLEDAIYRARAGYGRLGHHHRR
jgi:hypothetical protein